MTPATVSTTHLAIIPIRLERDIAGHRLGEDWKKGKLTSSRIPRLKSIFNGVIKKPKLMYFQLATNNDAWVRDSFSVTSPDEYKQALSVARRKQKRQVTSNDEMYTAGRELGVYQAGSDACKIDKDQQLLRE